MDWTTARLPAEWEPQEAVWFTWPVSTRHWGGRSLAEKWAEIGALISATQCVRINAKGSEHPVILKELQKASAFLKNVELYDHRSDDVWCRDHGALFVRDALGDVAATSWTFNGWGGVFSPTHHDNQMAARMASSQGMACREYPEVLEGGAIEINERGVLLTTEAVLLNPNRNPHLSKQQIERQLQKRLGVQEVVWLKEGIVGDDTGGHVDDIARFVRDDLIVVATDQEGPNTEVLRENWNRLAHWGGAQLVSLPLPNPCEVPGWRLPVLPASYANFLITNHLVLVPTFCQPSRDKQALGLLSELFPTREVVGINSLELVKEGGALHCISMNEPARAIVQKEWP